MASVRKRTYKDGTDRFVVDFKDDRGNRVLKTFERRALAVAFRNHIVNEVEAGKYIHKSQDITWQQAFDQWVENCQKRIRRGETTIGTAKAYECAALRILPHLKKMKLSEITTKHIQEAADELIAKKLSASSVRHSVNAAGRVFNLAIDNGHLKQSPIKYSKLALPRNRRKPQIPPKEALKAILSAVFGARGRYEQRTAYPQRAVIIALSLFGTMRRGEIVGLKWGDVDVERRVVSVRRSMSHYDGLKDTKTEAGVRSFVMAPPVFDSLSTLRELRDAKDAKPDDFVLLTSKGKPLSVTSVYGDHWLPTLIKAGLAEKGGKSPYRFHALRHAAGSLLIEQGVSPMHVKAMMGHSSVRTTIDTYGHLFPTDETLKKASERVALDLFATETRHDPLNA